MKVLHVNDYTQQGGAEVVLHRTVQGLADRGCTTDLFTADDVRGYRITPLRYVDSAPCRRGLRARLDAFRPDVVHLHNFYHLLSPGILGEVGRWRRGRRCRVVMTAHDYNLVCPNSGLRFFFGGEGRLADLEKLHRLSYQWSRRWDHRGLRHALLRLIQHVWNYRLRDRRRELDVLLCPSRFMQSVLEPFGLPALFLPNPAPPRMAGVVKPPGPLRLLFAGRVDPVKGLAEFLTLWPAGFDGRVEVIGDGPALPQCRRIIDQRGLHDRVSFVGRLPHDQVLRHLEWAHVAVLPSLWYENAPVFMIEALSRGANLLVSGLGGMREIVKESGIGYLFEPGNAQSLEAVLVEIRRVYADGRLNDFDSSSFLDARSEGKYFQRLIGVYEGNG